MSEAGKERQMIEAMESSRVDMEGGAFTATPTQINEKLAETVKVLTEHANRIVAEKRELQEKLEAYIVFLRGQVEEVRAEWEADYRELHKLTSIAQTRVEELEAQLKGARHANPWMDRAERAEAALRYVTRPSMGLPSGHDPEDFALNGASEKNARTALATCIRIANGVFTPHCPDCHGAGGSDVAVDGSGATEWFPCENPIHKEQT